MHPEKTHFFDRPKNVQLVMRIFYVICGLLLVLDLILRRHIYHAWEQLPGFYPLYGFVGCVILVVVAKCMRKVLMRADSYYESPRKGPSESKGGVHGRH